MVKTTQAPMDGYDHEKHRQAGRQTGRQTDRQTALRVLVFYGLKQDKGPPSLFLTYI